MHQVALSYTVDVFVQSSVNDYIGFAPIQLLFIDWCFNYYCWNLNPSNVWNLSAAVEHECKTNVQCQKGAGNYLIMTPDMAFVGGYVKNSSSLDVQ